MKFKKSLAAATAFMTLMSAFFTSPHTAKAENESLEVCAKATATDERFFEVIKPEEEPCSKIENEQTLKSITEIRDQMPTKTIIAITKISTRSKTFTKENMREILDYIDDQKLDKDNIVLYFSKDISLQSYSLNGFEGQAKPQRQLPRFDIIIDGSFLYGNSLCKISTQGKLIMFNPEISKQKNTMITYMTFFKGGIYLVGDYDSPTSSQETTLHTLLVNPDTGETTCVHYLHGKGILKRFDEHITFAPKIESDLTFAKTLKVSMEFEASGKGSFLTRSSTEEKSFPSTETRCASADESFMPPEKRICERCDLLSLASAADEEFEKLTVAETPADMFTVTNIPMIKGAAGAVLTSCFALPRLHEIITRVLQIRPATTRIQMLGINVKHIIKDPRTQELKCDVDGKTFMDLCNRACQHNNPQTLIVFDLGGLTHISRTLVQNPDSPLRHHAFILWNWANTPESKSQLDRIASICNCETIEFEGKLSPTVKKKFTLFIPKSSM